jgi:hypothetical protein
MGALELEAAEPLLARAEARLLRARQVLDDLQLQERWSAIGSVLLVGAVACGLVVAQDIDLEVCCDSPSITACFAVAAAFAPHPRIRRVRFTNDLAGPNGGLYFQLGYVGAGGDRWKIDTWVLGSDHPGPRSADLTAPLRRALTPETRRAILEIKEQVVARQAGGPAAGPDGAHSIDIYRAVLEGGARSVAAFDAWHARERPAGLTPWRPGG